MKRVFVIGNGESRKEMDLEQLRQYGKIYGCNALYRDFTPDALIAVDDRMVHRIYWSGYPLENQCYFRDWTRMPEEAYEMLLQPEMVCDDGLLTPDMIHSNEKGDRNEFVLHGVHKNRMKDAENITREQDKDTQVLTQDVYDILFTQPGFYISWLAETDKVQNTNDPEFLPGGTDYGLSGGALAHLIAIWVEHPDEIYFIGMDLYSDNDSVNNLYKGTPGYIAPGGNAVPPDEWILQHKTIMHKFDNVKHYKVNKKPLGDPYEDPINRVIPEGNDTPNLEYLTHADMFGKLVASSAI